MTPDVTTAIIHRGKPLAGAGGEMVVPWWSFTKTIIAATALTLVRDGAVALDQLLDGERYTLRQLLQHTAGLGDYGELAEYHAAVARHDDPWPVAEMLRRSRSDQLRYQPGAGWQYSNIGYLKVGQLIERRTGSSLGTAFEQAVFGPLGISGAKLVREPAELHSVAMGTADRYDPGWVYHGLLVGPLMQAARLLDLLLGGLLVPPNLVQEMRSARAVGPTNPNRPFVAPGYGLGLMTDMAQANPPIGHTGGGPGTTIAFYRRGHGDPVVIAAFAYCDDPGVVERAAFAAL